MNASAAHLLFLAAAVLTFGACRDREREAAARPVPPPAAAPKPAATGAGWEHARAALREVIHFDFDASSVRPEARAVLDAKARLLAAQPTLRLTLEGHADERGTAEYNVALGRRRAQAARRYLIDRGVAAARLRTTSQGEARPLDAGHTEAAWARNRRVEFHIQEQ